MWFRKTFEWMLFLLAYGCLMRPAAAQVIIDRRPEIPLFRNFEIKEEKIDGTIRDQVAEIQVTHTIHNPGAVTIEAEFMMPLPDEAAVRSLTLMVDGKEMPGRIVPRDEARRTYEEIVRRRRDPALMEWMGSGMFRTGVFPIPPGADRQVTVRLTQLCRRDGCTVAFTHLMALQRFCPQPIGKFTVNLRLTSQAPLKSIYSPTHEPKIERTGDREATVRLEQTNLKPETDFKLLYTLGEGPVGVTVLSHRAAAGEDGFFLLLLSPEIKKTGAKPQPKTVLFVLDSSGSMAGAKIEQARGALRFVLDNLREGDNFNLITYNDQVDTFKTTLQPYNITTRAEAQRFVETIEAGGGTNINEALQSAMRMLGNGSAPETTRPAYIIFLTDGLPTVSETKEKVIAENCRAANKAGARVFVFGVGYDVNGRLLDRLSGAQGGTSEYVKPSENIETHVASFYSRLTSPVLTGIKLELAGAETREIYPSQPPDLFDGGQLIIVGRYRHAGDAKLKLSGRMAGADWSQEYPVKLAESGAADDYAFVERVWAMRRIGYIIDQVDLNGENKELIDELVKLSQKYGILTPYTSYLADEGTADNAPPQPQPMDATARPQRRHLFHSWSKSKSAPIAVSPGTPGMMGMSMGSAGPPPDSGQLAFEQRALKSELKQAASPATLSLRKSHLSPSGEAAEQAVRQIGAKTFYRRQGRWVDSELKPDEEKNAEKNAVRLEQFSDKYFEFARTLKAEESQYLSFREPLLLKIGGKVYLIEPAKDKK